MAAKRTFSELASMVVTWWIVAFLHSELSVLTNRTSQNSQELSKDYLRK